MVLLHRNKHLLLQLRTKNADIYPGYWGALGGRGDPNEAIEDAALREIHEELGLILEKLDFQNLGKINVPRGGMNQKIYCFAAELRSSLSTLSLTEGDGFALFDSDQMDNLLVTPETRLAAQRLLQKPEWGWLS